MSAPNNALRAARSALRLSQDEFAHKLREAGLRDGRPNDASKRLVQRWESGKTEAPRAAYARALEMVTGLPIELLGFPAGADTMVVEDGRGGHDLEVRAPAPMGEPARGQGSYSGIWLSTYQFFSSGRDQAFTILHHVLVLQHGDRLTVRSLPGSAKSLVTMDASVDGSIITGTWVEQTELDGYYQGSRYFGAIQLISEPTGRRLAGKWVGFGRDGEVNTGPWVLTYLDSGTSKAAIAKYDRPPESVS
jgi:transcriptional regulator with XRE-family HTH domain